MGRSRQNNIFITIVTGYKNIFFYFLKILVVSGLILGATFLIVYPLWYSALHYTQVYSFAVAGILILGGILLVVKSIRKNILKERQLDRPPLLFIKRPLIRLLKLIVSIGYFYFFALFIYRHLYAAAAGSLVIFLSAAGYLLFSKKNR